MNYKMAAPCLFLCAVLFAGCRPAEQQKPVGEPSTTANSGPAIPGGDANPNTSRPNAVKGDQGSPEATIKAFAKAVESADLKTAAGYVQGADTGADFTFLAKGVANNKPTLTLSDLKVEEHGDRATAKFGLTIVDNQSKNKFVQKDTVELVRSGGGWSIVPDHSKRPPAFGALADSLLHADKVGRAAPPAGGRPNLDCASHMKQLALAAIMLASDNDDKLALTSSNWATAIMPYLKDKAFFHCPDDAGSDVSYSLNPAVAGKSFTAISTPADVVMFYEGKGGKLNFRHNGAAGVAFMDGHVRMVAQDAAKSLVWKP